jgi:CRISPR-associated endonuclease Csn1
MYSNDELNIDQLSSYDIDHIIPQAYTKDNSFDNRVLVSSKANRLKTNDSVVPSETVEKMKPLWLRMKDQGFISKRKFENLTRRGDFSEQQKERFIARALVETRQIIVNVSSLIDSHFNHTKAVAVKSNMTTDMRHYTKVPKNRDINDYHHAHDALFVATVGQYIENKGFMKAGKLSDSVGNEYNRYTKNWLETARKNTNYDRVNPFGFVVGSMQTATRGKLDYETGELSPVKNDYWSKDDLDYLLKVVSYKKILVTKKALQKQGNLYNLTRYGIPKKSGFKSEKLIPFDSKHRVDLYGGFSAPLTSFTALIKNKKSIELVNITAMEAAKLRKNGKIRSEILQDYLRQKVVGVDAKGNPKYVYPFVEVILPEVPSLQLVVKKRQKLYAVSEKEANNAEQLVVDMST